MEKTIEFKDVVAFIRKAMDNGMRVKEDLFGVYVYKENDKNSYIKFLLGDTIIIIKNTCGEYIIKISKKEHLEFEVLIEEIKQYQQQKVLKFFNNFFKEDSKPTDINDLDDEDDGRN